MLEGTQTITYTETDISGNESGPSPDLDIEVDITDPSMSIESPDLQDASDTGVSSTDNITNDTTPTFDISCAGTNAVTLYAQTGAASVEAVGIGVCSDGGVVITSTTLLDEVYDFHYTETDIAGNVGPDSETLSLLIVDTESPNDPISGINMTDETDTGSSNNDNLTNDETPDFDVVCFEVDSIISLPVAETVVGTYTCTAVGPAVMTAENLSEGIQDMSYTETDVGGNESDPSASLVIEVDLTEPTSPTVSEPVDGTHGTGTFIGSGRTVGEIVTVTVQETEEMCSDVVDSGGDWGCDLVETPDNGPIVADVTVTDLAGNVSESTMVSSTIDTVAPVAPTINPVLVTDSSITGTSEPLATIDFATSTPGVTCDTVVTANAAGVWTCTVTSVLAADDGVAITAVDAAGNVSGEVSTVVVDESHTSQTPQVEPTDGSAITGIGVPNSIITITDTAGPVVICQTSVTPSGAYVCMPNTGVVPIAGSVLEVTQTTSPLIESPVVEVTVIDIDSFVSSPEILLLSESVIMGTTEPYAVTHIVDSATDATLCLTVADASGGYVCPMTPNLTDGTGVSVTATIDSNTSNPTSATLNIDDNDNDGVSDADEDIAGNSGDGNGDGIQDYMQSHVTTVMSPATSAPVTMHVESGNCQVIDGYQVGEESDIVAQDGSYNYPVGIFEYELYCTGLGETAAVTFYFDQVYDTSNWVWRKYDRNTKSYGLYPNAATFKTAVVGTDTVTSATLLVTDNASEDEDKSLNARILDPSGPAEVYAPGGSTRSSSGGGSRNSSHSTSSESEETPVIVAMETITETSEIDEGVSDVKESNVVVVDSDESICSPYMTGHVKYGSAENDPLEVMKLERFLNEKQGETVVVDGVYGAEDFAAVKRFQQKYSSEVLQIWGLSEPTGYVFKTTLLKINSFYCSGTIQCPYFVEYNNVSENNSSQEVRRAKVLMKDLGFYAGAIDTNYDAQFKNTMSTFQETFRQTMLDPWGLKQGTGYKYKTTNKFLNMLVGCDTGAVELDGQGTFDY